MPYDPDKHKRRSVRLRRYDYARAGAYFVTVVAQHRACLFGEVVEGEMRLNSAGEMVETWWHKLPEKHSGIDTDAFVIMPNHVHGIVIINTTVGATQGLTPDFVKRGRPRSQVTSNAGQPHGAAPTGDANPTLGDIVRWFKTMTTNAYIRGVREDNWTPFDKRLWQHNYYEHVIRNENSLNETRRYIGTNPLRWHLDSENPHLERGRL